VASLKRRAPERFDVLEFLPGEEAQVDYGQGVPTLHANGKYRRPYDEFRIVGTLDDERPAPASGTVGQECPAGATASACANSMTPSVAAPGNRAHDDPWRSVEMLRVRHALLLGSEGLANLGRSRLS